MNAPQWRLQILAGMGPFLRQHGFRGSKTRYWKVIGDRKLRVQLSGGSDQHDTQKLAMLVFLGKDFPELESEEERPSAHGSLWWGYLSWNNLQGVREVIWRAYSETEALEVTEGIKSALPPALARMEERFQTWHDVLPYLNKEARDTFDPPGYVNEWELPKVG